MSLQATSGAASYDAFGGGVVAEPNYIESVFSTYLYTGNGSSQTITNGIDLSGKGGMVWIKCRTPTAYNNWLSDTVRGNTKRSSSNTTSAESTLSTSITSFNSNGFSIGSNSNVNDNGANETYASWTFRKQPKFFDVVTWTGSGANRTIAHNLGSVPACIIVKRTDASASWSVYHRSLANTQYLTLNTNDDVSTDTTTWNSTTATSTVFSLGTDTRVNASGGTYVAYIFAHDAGGFGLTGTDNVISCGSFTTGTGFGAFNVNLGWEPQWVLIKRTDGFRDWVIYDTMRGFNTRNLTGDADASALYPNLSSAEDLNGYVGPYATGFSSVYTGTASANYIYIAIRRGPMKVPTSGTSVYNAITRTGTGAVAQVTGVGFTPDNVLVGTRSNATDKQWQDRLRGPTIDLATNRDYGEITHGDSLTSFNMDGCTLGADTSANTWNISGRTYVNWFFKRAPSFFDEVCYKNNASGASEQVNNHNLGVIPELAITKVRNDVNSWYVASNIGSTTFDRSFLDSSAASVNLDYVSASTYKGFTSTTFTVGSSSIVGAGGFNVVTYLFATCAGVSKVGSYTGNGSNQTINCGFTGGARFVMIKATSTTGNWIVADSARGIVAGNDPALYLNSTAAEVTGLDWIDADNSGFVVNETATIAANTNGVSYIFFAVA